MIVETVVPIKLNSQNYDYWISKGYAIPTHMDTKRRLRNFKRGSILFVNVPDLQPVSNVKITAICVECNKKRKLPFYRYTELCWTCNLKKLNQKGNNHGRHNKGIFSSGEERKFDLYIRRAYSITIEDYYKILENQNYCCAICNTPQANEGRRFAIDHLKNTKIVRGILCQPCNTAIGLLKENTTSMLKAMDYVNKDYSK